jgi:hypothetical protein
MSTSHTAAQLFSNVLAIAIFGCTLTASAYAGEWKQVRADRIPGSQKASSGNIFTGYGSNGSISAQGFAIGGATAAKCKDFSIYTSSNSYSAHVAAAGFAINAWAHVGQGTGEVELSPVLLVNGTAEVDRGEGSASASGFVEYRYKIDADGEVTLRAELPPLSISTTSIGLGALSSPQGSLYITIASGHGTVTGNDVNGTYADEYPAAFFREIGRSQGNLTATAFQTFTGPGNSFSFSLIVGSTTPAKVLISHPW